MPRVISLVPSATETLIAWGVTPVACTRFCERAGIETVGGTKDPDVTRIRSLAPDLVVMDTEENRLEDFEALEAAGTPVHTLAIRDVSDLDSQLPALAERLGATWRPLAPGLGSGPGRGPRLRALVPVWRRPWMALGVPTYGASLLARLGFDVVPSHLGPYPEVELDREVMVALGVDVIVAPSEPYPFGERHRSELEGLAPVVFVDGRDLFWWGHRTEAALGRLAVVLAHGAASAAGEPGYVDPVSGLYVFTADFLAGRPCCGNGCRHCPHQPDDPSRS